MSFQTFTAPSLKEAKIAMRASLGQEAVILATKKCLNGKIEIRAIKKGMPLFDGEGPKNSAPAARPPSSLAARGIATRNKTMPPAARPISKSSTEGSGLHNQIEKSAAKTALNHLKGDFSEKLGASKPTTIDPVYRDIREALQPQGISPNLIRALSAEARQAPHNDLTGMLEYAFSKVMKFAPLSLSPDIPIMLMGQTGAGKTSSAAKLAAKAASMGAKAAFMCADIGRAGALDQMTTYAEALDTKFWPIEDPQDVINIIKHDQPQEILILDSPGVSPFAPADIAAMKSFRQALDGEPVLVLPASGDVNEHIDWANAFRDIGVRRCIVTKFDTSRRIGAAISAAFEGNLALAHFSEAPFIADGLIDANPAYLAHRLLLTEPARIGSGL